MADTTTPRRFSVLYEEIICKRDMTSEPAQAQLAARFDRLGAEILKEENFFYRFWPFRKKSDDQGALKKGIYIYGSVGSGKSMMMDIFFENIPIRRKSRHHFHDFMAMVQNRLDAARKSQIDDPLLFVTKNIAAESRLICLDEMFITDIVNAMLIHRLFSYFLSHGTWFVITSNQPPDELYRDGLNRQHILPFIAEIKKSLDLYSMQVAYDYRLLKTINMQRYYSPLNGENREAINQLWEVMTKGMAIETRHLKVKGRQLTFPRATSRHLRVDFAEICEKPLGPYDYIALAENFQTIFIENIPELNDRHIEGARRFITLIDILYDRHIHLVISAESERQSLYKASHTQEAFEYKRIISRLFEMQSESWWLESPRKIELSSN